MIKNVATKLYCFPGKDPYSVSQIKRLLVFTFKHAIQAENPCRVCKKDVEEKDEGLNYKYSHAWHHITCINIDSDHYKFLQLPGKGTHWFCVKCNKKAVDVLKLMQSINEKEKALHERTSALEEKMEKITSLKDEEFVTKFRNIICEESHEIKERERKAENITVAGLPEMDPRNDWDRKSINNKALNECENDREMAGELLLKLGFNSNEAIEEVHRAPRDRRENDDRARLLIV